MAEELQQFVEVLKFGGGYAMAAIFLIMLLRSQKRESQLTDDLREISLAKLENDMKTVASLDANADALENVGNEFKEEKELLRKVKVCLEKILWVKQSKIQIEE